VEGSVAPVEAQSPAGWYDDPEDGSRKRWWTGSEWPTQLSDAERREALDQRVAWWVSRGWSVQSRTDTQAVLATGHRPNHLLHLILSVLTLGLWLLVWIFVALGAKEQLATVSVAADGRAIEQ
jgi:hypothetical protein